MKNIHKGSYGLESIITGFKWGSCYSLTKSQEKKPMKKKQGMEN